MKRFTKALSMLLAIVMVVGLLPLSIIAEDIQTTHTVQFKLNYNGAHKIPSQKVADGECAVQPEDVTREGWIFEYWYVKTGDGIQKFDLAQPITEDVTLYARWDEDITYWGAIWNRNITGSIASSSNATYTVTFEANGDGVENLPEAQRVKYGDEIVYPTQPTREGYLFAGWYCEPECVTKFDFTEPLTSDVSVYPLWNEDEVDWDVVGELYAPALQEEDIMTDPETGIMYAAGQLMITVNDGVSHEEFLDMIEADSGRIIGRIEVANDYLVLFDKNMTLDALKSLVEQYASDSRIAYVGVNYIAELTNNMVIPEDEEWNNTKWTAPNQTASTEQDNWVAYTEARGDNWGIEAANIHEAWKYNDEMEPIKIGLIDAGFDTQHDDLIFAGVFNNSYVNNRQRESDYINHGTHVAGTMAAQWNSVGIAGIVKKSKLYGYNICGDADNNVSNLSDTFHYKFALATLIIRGVKIINISMGYNYPESHLMNQNSMNIIDNSTDAYTVFINSLLDKGYDFLIIQAAGNASNNEHYKAKAIDPNTGYPKGYYSKIKNEQGWVDTYWSGLFVNIDQTPASDHVIVVGALDMEYTGVITPESMSMRTVYRAAHFTQIGDNVDIFAPGVNILSTISNDEYNGAYSGTSMAAPHVSGVAAITWAINPALSGKQVRDILLYNNEATGWRSVGVDTRIVVQNGANNATVDATVMNQTYDYVILDALHAVELARETVGEGNEEEPNFGYVTGFVQESELAWLDNLKVSEGARVYLDNIAVDDEDGSGKLTTDENGLFSMLVAPGSHIIEVAKSGFMTCTYYLEVVGGESYNISLYLIEDDIKVDKTFKIGGTVTNAVNNNPLENATVFFRSGLNNKSGPYYFYTEDGNEVMPSARTNSNGYYEVTNIRAGCYTAQISLNGFITGFVNVYVFKNDTGFNAVLAPITTGDQIRLVLTWNADPRDIDSHLKGTYSTGGDFHVYYGNKTASHNGTNIVNLDVDDTTSYGPETTTITFEQDVTYHYYIHDFAGDGTLATSGAKVEVYRGSTLINTFNVPYSTTSTDEYWDVCTIRNGVVTSINKLSPSEP